MIKFAQSAPKTRLNSQYCENYFDASNCSKCSKTHVHGSSLTMKMHF